MKTITVNPGSCGNEEGEFVYWLKSQGYDVEVGSNLWPDEEKNEFQNNLWKQFCSDAAANDHRGPDV